ncbi:flavin reductase [Leptospira wolffii]|uniref:flavin reductase family protein n=1 Tax=Leptospira wolffii TaxID=409998 RepID=UPI00108303A8|nr:flavin reductase family protein [Leptospira wolffii]TGK62659.1 flavin reductase [Leptospira wolffii]TGK65634.1 flavin reductase [Leptospira wolffii]TGK73954.1 flavin reductase [Leptospira wolffii]TGL28815.1 flavin reductase [Leptospira wolffii]
MSFSTDEFKNALSHFASGVTVVTFSDPLRSGGLTVSSFSSLSLDPPLVLFSLQKNIASHDPLLSSGLFTVNVLASDQEELSNQFASGKIDKHELIQKLGCDLGHNGVPFLNGTLSRIECEVDKQVDGGDHTIVIGRVLASVSDDSKRPLLYYRRKYYNI